MNIQHLKEQRLRLYNQMRDIVNDAKKENRGLTPDEQQQFDNAEADMKNYEGDIRRMEALQERSYLLKEKREELIDKSSIEAVMTAEKVFEKYLRGGRLTQSEAALLRPAQYRGTSTQVAGTDNLGGYAVPEGFSGYVDLATAFVGEVEKVARVFNTLTGNPIKFPTVDDTATDASRSTEGGAITVQDITFAEKTLNAYTYPTLIKSSFEFDTDSGVPLASLIMELAAERIARGTNAALTTGDGSGDPNGVLTAAALGKTAASATAITQAELVDLYHSVDPSYRASSSCYFMVHDNIYSVIRKLGLTASQDVPAVRIGQDGELYINGKQVLINQDMTSTITTTDKTVLFGDFGKYIVRTVGGINMRILTERYADALTTGYVVWRRLDGELMQSGAMKYLQQA